MNKLMMLAGVSAAFLPLALGAADYTLKSAPQTYEDWTNKAFWENEDVPPTDGTATVLVPASMTDIVVTDETIGFVNAMKNFKFLTGSTQFGKITVDLTNDVETTTAFGNGNTWKNFPEFVKKGPGTLVLAATGNKSGNSYGNYIVKLDVQEGVIDNKTGFFLGGVNLESDTTMLIHGGESKATAVTYRVYLGGLTGSGTVTNTTASSGSWCVLHLDGYETTPSVFSGRLCNVYLQCDTCEHLTGTESIVSDAYVRSGILGVQTMTVTDGKSSIGEATPIYLQAITAKDPVTQKTVPTRTAGALRYLGIGEDVTKHIYIYQTAVGPATIDAGENGGLNFTGYLRSYTDGSVERLVLTGSNTLPCMVSCAVGGTDSANPASFYITKRGTGRWNFAHYTGVNRNGIGGLGVEDGVVGVETFNEPDKTGSLGLTDLFVMDVAQANGGRVQSEVPYFFTFGDTNSAANVGLVEYYGTATAYVQQRPAVVQGKGGFRTSDTNAGQLVYSAGVKAIRDGATFVLDGSADGSDEVRGIFDGDNGERLGVEKRGTGTWTISGEDNTFSGPIAVKNGTLVLRGISGKFTWFHQVITDRTYLDMNEFGYFDAEGNLVSRGLTLTPGALGSDKRTINFDNADWPKISPGECCPDIKCTLGLNLELANLFDGQAGARSYFYLKDGEALSYLIRLPRGTAEVRTFDFATTYGKYEDHFPYAWTIYGSVDGVKWYVADVHAADEGIPTYAAGNNDWRYNHNQNVGTTTGAVPPLKLTGGRPIVGYTNDVVVVYSNPVSVENGATLEAEGLVKLTSLKVNATATAGTVKGFLLADDLTIDVSGVPKGQGRTVLPLDFDGVSGLSDPENWTIKENGTETSKFSAAVVDGKIVLDRSGMVIIFR